MFTTERVANGWFHTFWNGKRTAYIIFNGDLGCSGSGTNIYGITLPNRKNPSWIGSLQKAKKHCEKWVQDAAAKDSLVYWTE